MSEREIDAHLQAMERCPRCDRVSAVDELSRIFNESAESNDPRPWADIRREFDAANPDKCSRGFAFCLGPAVNWRSRALAAEAALPSPAPVSEPTGEAEQIAAWLERCPTSVPYPNLCRTLAAEVRAGRWRKP
jgi:hypothetical protein